MRNLIKMNTQIKQLENIKVNSPSGRPFLLDLYYENTNDPSPLVVFCHGIKGFKDWGAWSLIAAQFAQSGIAFAKFNFSYNGCSVTQPEDLKDLDAFAQNNYSNELKDLQACIVWLKSHIDQVKLPIDTSQIHLIGHSRGGGLVLSVANQLENIGTVTGWASVQRLDYAWLKPGFISDWKEKGYYTILNSRTGDTLKLDYQFYQDFKKHQERFTISNNLPQFKGRILLCHGDRDVAVPFSSAEALFELHPTHTELVKILDCDHVFNMKHPWDSRDLPDAAQELVNKTINFIKSNISH